MTEPATPATPAVFIHGLWLHATSWGPWLDLFREAGYEPVAPGWPHEPDTVAAAREQPELVANTSIDEAVEHYATIIAGLGAPPVIIGHSFGGLITEKLLGQGIGAAGVAIDPAQIKGVLPLPLAQLRAGLPALGNPANLHRAVSLTRVRVPVRLRQRRHGAGVRRAVRPVDDPVAGATPVPGGRRQLRAALGGQGQHGERDPRPAAADLRDQGPHRARRGDPVDVQAVPRLHGGHRAAPVRGTRALAHGGQRLEGRGRRRARLAEGAGPVTGRVRSWT